MRWRFLLAAIFVACTPSSQNEEAEAPHPAITQLTTDLRARGIPARAERLKSLREFPGCEDAELRYRLRFEADFVNVSRFSDEPEAKACLGEFRNTVLKAGELAWEQMRGDISTHGPWLFFFPPDPRGEDRRAEILSILRTAQK